MPIRRCSGESTRNSPPKRPVGLPAEVLRGLLVDEHDPAAGVGELGGGDEAGETGSDDDDVSVHGASLAGQCAQLQAGSPLTPGGVASPAKPVPS